MGQKEIIDLLKMKPNEWVTKREIYEYCKVGDGSVTIALRKLIQAGEIERKFVYVPNRKKKDSDIMTRSLYKIDNQYYERLKREGLV